MPYESEMQIFVFIISEKGSQFKLTRHRYN